MSAIRRTLIAVESWADLTGRAGRLRKRMSRGRRTLRALLAAVVATTVVAGFAPAASATECGCTETGPYEAPAVVNAVTGSASPRGGTFTLTTSQDQAFATLAIRRASNNSLVQSFTVPLSRLRYGWSPDGNRFLVQHGLPGSVTLDEVILWDLADDEQVVATTVKSGAAAAFSPHGRWFYVNQLHGPGWAGLTLWSANAPGTPALSTDITFANVPGSGADNFGSIGLGFSSDSADRSFVYAFRATNGSTEVVVRNLETRQTVYSTSLLNATGAFWRFSPCGDAFGIVSSPLANTAVVRLQKTATTGALGTEKSFSAMPADIELETTPDQHRVKVTSSTGTVSYTNVASNTADTDCPAAPTLSTLSLNRTTAIGGTENVTATLTLTSAATSAMTVTLTSSDTAAATVPSSVTVPTGATTRTFTVTTRTVSSAGTVRITAAVPGVTKTATLTVNPVATQPAVRRVTALAVAPTSVTAGQTATATLTLDEAAPTGGTVVALSSSSSAVSVPTSTTVPAGSTSHRVVIPTSAGASETAATLVASAGGGTATASLDVRPAAESPTSPQAVVTDPGCLGATLRDNDDDSTGDVPLPFTVNFFGVRADHLYVNNNGNVTFGRPLSAYTPFRINADTPPIIAPFLADVDTRGTGSRQVTHSTTPVTFGGRPAFCVNWVDVGYFPTQTDKLNSFQLLLVDRSDIGQDGDFDIVMNYDRVLWETGSASGGTGGLGGNSAGAGYSAGTGAADAFYEFPGTLVNGAFLDNNPTTGLTRTSRETLQLGRHIFQVRSGTAPTGRTLRGLVTGPSGVLIGAAVQVCDSTACRAFTTTGVDGRYQAPGLPPGDYQVRVQPPAGSNLYPRTLNATVGTDDVNDVDVELAGPTPLPADTSLSPSTQNGQGIPSVYWRDAVTVETKGCVGATGTWQVIRDRDVVAQGELSETPAGQYTGQIPPLYPLTGAAQIVLSLDCPGDVPDERTRFDIYIDPSGNVRTLLGTPISDAVVTLLRSDTENGEFTVVPDGSPIMSPTNRRNPDRTDVDGHFGWDTIAGFYKVRAERDGCTAPGDPSETFVETSALNVPPEWTQLDLRLDCPGLDPQPEVDTIAPETSDRVTPSAASSGWQTTPATVTISATDGGSPASGVASIAWEMTGAQTDSGTAGGDGLTLQVANDGVTTIRYTATDAAGNTSEQSEVVVRLDTTRPTVRCPVTPTRLTTPNHRLVDVEAALSVADATSGPNGFTLASVVSNEPDNGLGDGDTPGDIQNWLVGTADTAGQFRAERAGTGAGRVYTLTYDARDVAGNTASCQATVEVPRAVTPPSVAGPRS
jgi:hypothetical protein